jgi:hypothetical protein
MQDERREIITPVNLSDPAQAKRATDRQPRSMLLVVACIATAVISLATGGIVWFAYNRVPRAPHGVADTNPAAAPTAVNTQSQPSTLPSTAATARTEHATTPAIQILPSRSQKSKAPASTSVPKSLHDEPVRSTSSRASTVSRAQTTFQAFLSDGLQAYHAQEYERARGHLLKAQKINPDSLAVQEALVQVDHARRLTHLAALQQRARSAEQAEQWAQAQTLYKTVLDIDSTVQFAVQGYARSQQRLQLEQAMTRYIRQPRLLQADAHLNQAEALLVEVRASEPHGPNMRRMTHNLQQVVAVAKTPVMVTLASDNLTEVAVYRVGRLGTFVTRQLTLRPGVYTVVGSRHGYKDVRQTVVVQAEQTSLRVVVQCREKI